MRGIEDLLEQMSVTLLLIFMQWRVNAARNL
jgi:hypothetical protein